MTDHATGSQAGQKSVLFCQVCGHDAPLEAGWDVSESAKNGSTDIACSQCGHVVVTQPTFEDVDGEETIFSPVTRFLNTVVSSGVSSTQFAARLT